MTLNKSKATASLRLHVVPTGIRVLTIVLRTPEEQQADPLPVSQSVSSSYYPPSSMTMRKLSRKKTSAIRRVPITVPLVAVLTAVLSKQSSAFMPAACSSIPLSRQSGGESSSMALHMSDSNDNNSNTSGDWQNNAKGSDSSTWKSADDDNYDQQEDWQDVMSRKKDGSFWSDFEPSDEETMIVTTDLLPDDQDDPVDADAEAWLEALASISAEEVEFNMNEAKRADKAREMAEWGFDSETIKNTFGIAVDDTLEKDSEGMKAFREESYLEDEDWKEVESHSKVEKDDDNGEPVRQQMVCFIFIYFYSLNRRGQASDTDLFECWID
jgi:hypothetical protein